MVLFFFLLLIPALLKLIFLARDKETIDKPYVAIDGLEGTGLCSYRPAPFEMVVRKTTDNEIRCSDIEVSSSCRCRCFSLLSIASFMMI